MSSASSLLPSHCLKTSFIDDLPEPFLEIARECIPPPSPDDDDDDDDDKLLLLLPAASERADNLEIHLRSHLLQLVQKSLVVQAEAEAEEGTSLLEDVGIFWKRSLELCLHFVYFSEHGGGGSGSASGASGGVVDERYKGMSVRKLPLLLLEDALDALPLKSFQQIWETIVEPAFPILFSNVLWHGSSGGIGSGPNSNKAAATTTTPCALPFIKLCNKFLRKLADAHQQNNTDDWPGRILLTLARAFPLNDKSATKIWGSFHTENVTLFETEAEFDTQQQDLQQQQQQAASSEHHHHHHHHHHNSSSSNKQLQTYSFYETFWSIQNDFSNPTGIKVADFLERMRTILAALESHPLIRSHTISILDGSHTNDDSQQQQQSTTTRNHQVKYLTSSHLLPIQLGDPEFRIHFLTQFLIVENHLSSESPALGNMLGQLNKRAKDLLSRIQPHGNKHLQILEFILQHREKYWRLWKKNKCQPDLEIPFVKEEEQQDEEAAAAAADGASSSATSNNNKKRRLLDGPLGGGDATTKKKKDEEELLIDFILHEKKDLKATCALEVSPSTTNAGGGSSSRIGNNNARRSKVIPTLEEHLEPYVDALDPDAGIEAEYHPKNDSLFTWRALRLLSVDHLGKFHMINHKGDFEKMVRHIYAEEKGVQIPGEEPAPEEHSVIETVPTKEEEEEDDDEEEDEQEAAPAEEEKAKQEDGYRSNNGDEDEEMKDVAKEDTNPEQQNKPSEIDAMKESIKEEDAKIKEEEKQDAHKGKAPMETEEDEEEGSQDDEKDTGSRESPVPMDEDDEKPLDDDDDDELLDDDDDDDEPTRVKEEIESEDEGEIEEGQSGKDNTESPSSAPLDDDKEIATTNKDRPPSRNEAASAPVKEETVHGDTNKHTDRHRDEDRGDGGGGGGRQQQPQQQQQKGRGGGGGSGGDFQSNKGKQQQQQQQQQHRGGRGHYNRNDTGARDRNDGYNRESDDRRQHRDRDRQHGSQHRGGRGGGGHHRSDGDNRRDGGGGYSGPPGSSGRRDMHGGGGRRDDRRGDERWDDRRGGGGGGGGSGGGSRRDGGGDRRGGDRRFGGRGEGRRHRR